MDNNEMKLWQTAKQNITNSWVNNWTKKQANHKKTYNIFETKNLINKFNEKVNVFTRTKSFSIDEQTKNKPTNKYITNQQTNT